MNSQHHYQLISEALHWLCENQREQPSLQALAQHVGLSPQYLQRLFQDWAGISPKQFLKHLTRTQAMDRLRQGQTVLESALSSGLSGPVSWDSAMKRENSISGVSFRGSGRTRPCLRATSKRKENWPKFL